MVDAAGAIYVIGGYNDPNYYHDVWASTDGGVRAALGRGGYSRGYLRGTTGGTQEY